MIMQDTRAKEKKVYVAERKNMILLCDLLHLSSQCFLLPFISETINFKLLTKVSLFLE